MTTEQDRLNLNKDVSNTSDVVDERRDEADEPGPDRSIDSVDSISRINSDKRVTLSGGRKTKKNNMGSKRKDLESKRIVSNPTASSEHSAVLGGTRDGSTLEKIKTKVAAGAVVYVDGAVPSDGTNKELAILREANPGMKFGIHAKTGTFNGMPFEAKNILKELPDNFVILEQTDMLNKSYFDSVAAAHKGKNTMEKFDGKVSSSKERQKGSMSGKMSDKELSELNISTKEARTKFISGMIKMGKKLSAGDFKFAKANKLFEEDSDTGKGNLGGRSKEQDGGPSNAKPTE
jgi:hypothetical protein